MGVREAFFAVLVVFLVFCLSSEAVDTRNIDRVRDRGVLESEDFRIIDGFWADAVRELLETEDFTSTSRTRTAVLSRVGSNKESAAEQYATQFLESAYKHISEGFKAADGLTPEDVRFKVVVNLLILVDALENPRLASLAVEKLNSDSAVVRYRAVRVVANPVIIKSLNSTNPNDLKLAAKIGKQFKELVNISAPETIALIAGFAAEINIAQGEELLLQIADKRISEYKDWTVENERIDADILKFLCLKVSSGQGGNAAFARRFGQLYSYAMQRYIKGQNFLDDTQKGRLISVLVETEQSCIGKLLDMPQSVVKKAIEQNDATALLLEHSRLLGDETRAGKLMLKLKYDYGEGPGGGRATVPAELPEPPDVSS